MMNKINEVIKAFTAVVASFFAFLGLIFCSIIMMLQVRGDLDSAIQLLQKEVELNFYAAPKEVEIDSVGQIQIKQ